MGEDVESELWLYLTALPLMDGKIPPCPTSSSPHPLTRAPLIISNLCFLKRLHFSPSDLCHLSTRLSLAVWVKLSLQKQPIASGFRVLNHVRHSTLAWSHLKQKSQQFFQKTASVIICHLNYGLRRTRAAAPPRPRSVARTALKRAHTVKLAEQIPSPELRRGSPKNVLLAAWAGSSLLFHTTPRKMSFPWAAVAAVEEEAAWSQVHGSDTWAAGSTEAALSSWWEVSDCFNPAGEVQTKASGAPEDAPRCSTCLFMRLCKN